MHHPWTCCCPFVVIVVLSDSVEHRWSDSFTYPAPKRFQGPGWVTAFTNLQRLIYDCTENIR